MVMIYCNTINEELRKVAKIIAENQKDVVKIVCSETLEVHYEKAPEEKEKNP